MSVIARMLERQRRSSEIARLNAQAASQRAIDCRDEVLELVAAAIEKGTLDPPGVYDCSDCRRQPAAVYHVGWFDPDDSYAPWGVASLCEECAVKRGGTFA